MFTLHKVSVNNGMNLSLGSCQSFSSFWKCSLPLDFLILCYVMFQTSGTTLWVSMTSKTRQGPWCSRKCILVSCLNPNLGVHKFCVPLWDIGIGESSFTKPRANTFLARMSISIGNNLRLSTSGMSVEGERDRNRRRESFPPSRALRVNKAMGWRIQTKSDCDEKVTTGEYPPRGLLLANVRASTGGVGLLP